MTRVFQEILPHVVGNDRVREPQREAYEAIAGLATLGTTEKEFGIILPVGCGKSGTITLAPFALKSSRTLVIAPGLNIATQLVKDFDPSNSEMFYQKCAVLCAPPFPEPTEIRGTESNRSDLDSADVVITNVHQLQGGDNRWLQSLPFDYFDLILCDEGHHSVAATWEAIKTKFPNARVINFSATPLRADGQIMGGRVIYSYPIFKAIEAGYVKRLKALQLNPRTLKYVRQNDGEEIEVDLDEVRRLGEEDADFRRSIVTSKETLATVVDASIRELDRLRSEASEARLKIIASALNYEHCRQVVEAYRARGRRADYVHSRENSTANARVLKKLENHELDVIVQVRKLGEGFDHPFLAVAAVLSIFANLSPFVQFVGRIMRVVKQNNPGHPVNRGTVVFHAGANVARRWGDFRQFSKADQSYFDQLLPLEGMELSGQSEREYEPTITTSLPEVMGQSEIQLEEIQLIGSDMNSAIQLLKSKGLIDGDFDPSTQSLKPIPLTKVATRQAARRALNQRIQQAAGMLIGKYSLKADGHQLDRKRIGKTNLQVLLGDLNRRVASHVGKDFGERSEFSQSELDSIEAAFTSIVESLEQEIFSGH
ncbi:DEAD/DEAH box helicase [Xanthomonas hortorum pv. vitians]|uniref:DEAD/DEAH box helicase family protein n=4 Tax=Xanthomonas hortorum TaxID=56454 RepID=A0A6V7F1W8_9XANT|nr:DEAD/DEAH box helicase family protein [Xanthomonas hortorum]APP81554.1 DEAD/DEAH box helicase [Xanthomonas hortorum pv. gardneri]ASW48212.1 DEAD/DEAH box helicase [Xanthomonas hortorum]KLA94980.1 DEAD/DEAH box helicase [Xanthomonas hortorum pv. gardneri]KLA98853.1 DEAD/DEAH box helicase [Xanthomonas hortorum pv. gardneri]KLB02678.1 DEAD/DEAH box helicase [Xanthomonas hortorum pv. gardneri]